MKQLITNRYKYIIGIYIYILAKVCKDILTWPSFRNKVLVATTRELWIQSEFCGTWNAWTRQKSEGDHCTLSSQVMHVTSRKELGKFSQLIQNLQSIVHQVASSLRQCYNVTTLGLLASICLPRLKTKSSCEKHAVLRVLSP